ncbi:TetR family transcriptional regulator [Williamsia limnetica]|uniref:TetR family transcriptional regulator n=1 Tax=Williamsia limnetica TaxID=882452 RepID=A0A318RIV9_WILLI|nr:TetR/AcrR family transcriptional regulator [Williamsia limnetica]PYE16276.1 TetR family transcriptional regulator [Williamsia limnetica]
MVDASGKQAQSIWESRALDRSAVRAQDKTAARQLLTAREIIGAGRRLFAESSSFQFTMKQVSVQAGVALQTVYRHFETKDLLVLAILEEEIRSSVAKIETDVAKIADPLEKVHSVITGPASRQRTKQQNLMGAAIVREHLRLQVDHPADVALVTAPYFVLMEDILRTAADAGALQIVDPKRDAQIIQHLVMSFYHQFALGVVSGDPAQETAYLWEFCRAALDRGTTAAEAVRPRRRSASKKQPT